MTASKGKAVDDKSKLSTRLRGKSHHDRRLTTHILYYPIIETTGNLVVMNFFHLSTQGFTVEESGVINI
ncbi:hypothetical protein RhiirA4_467852 [Rhizophagus irregularis]|uniref:Uncharacterized protein n=1 Tax=Rhizophagus irregularis TaxID=588596 RepID=A0A2I1GWP5_9GLOM|nr:hypothetical protein RhiirA4_467852 [Rhizophagus irregularis]